jgi:hypothetical protein
LPLEVEAVVEAVSVGVERICIEGDRSTAGYSSKLVVGKFDRFDSGVQFFRGTSVHRIGICIFSD